MTKVDFSKLRGSEQDVLQTLAFLARNSDLRIDRMKREGAFKVKIEKEIEYRESISEEINSVKLKALLGIGK
jgi:nickel-dependent lactate racemase